MSFKRDFKLGQTGEDVVIKLFKKNSIDLEKNTTTGKLSDYDLEGKLGSKKVTLEIKLDWLSEKTNNLAIEYKNCRSGKKSGIDATKSKLWVQIIMDMGLHTVWVASTKELKKFVKTTKPFKTVKYAGDGNAELYLYSNDIILDAVFHRIDNIDNSKFTKIINKLI